MYLKHFGLKQYPFTLTPDTEFFLHYGEFKDALDVLYCALENKEGLTKITGEIGTGKTLLCHKLLNSLDESFVTSYIPNPPTNSLALHRALAKELGLKCGQNIGQPRLLETINERLVSLHAEGKQAVLLVDEAQSLPDDSLEALRLLSNMETEKNKLLQLVLIGQPKLDERLQQDHLQQLRQRIVYGHRLNPLSSEALNVYLQHRLHVAGYRGASLFSPQALSLLQGGSRGIPRLINVLAHKALLVAFGRDDREINAIHISKAIVDTDGVSAQRQRLTFTAALCGFLGLTPASL